MEGSLKLGHKIREIRGGLTQRQFARLLSVSQGTVAKYETGHSFPKAATLCRIAEYSGEAMERILIENKNADEHENTTGLAKRVDRLLLSNEEIELVIAIREMAKNEPEIRSMAISLVCELAKSVKQK